MRASSSPVPKLDVLMDIERMQDDRVVPFLLAILGDCDESEEVRIHVLKRLRIGAGLDPIGHRRAVASAIGKVMAEAGAADLRLEAALALGAFIEIDGVLSRLIALSLAKDESIDLRYAAFTSLERAGPTPECVAVLRQLSTDEILGRSARSVLSAWHIENGGARQREEEG
jgi:hypothetical protein